jgi:hypothetical protein
MVRRETWILIVILLVLVGVAYYLNTPEVKFGLPSTNESTPKISPTPVSSFVFPNDSSVVQRIKIQDANGSTTELERGPGGVWVLKAPFEGIADQAEAESAATQVAALRIVAELTNVPELNAVGLLKPNYILTVSIKDAGEQTIKIGGPTVTGNGYYIQTADGKIIVLNNYSVEALTNLIKTPPFAATPTPSPIPATETSTPETTGEGTPVMELTSTPTP